MTLTVWYYSTVDTWLKNLFENLNERCIEHVWISTAFFNIGTLLYLIKLPQFANTRFTFLTGDMNYFNSPNDLKQLLFLESVTTFFSERKNLHSKFYAMKIQDKVHILVGSSNLTNSGFFESFGNIESNLAHSIDVKEWLKFWDSFLEKSDGRDLKLNKEILKKYENSRSKFLSSKSHISNILNGLTKPATLVIYSDSRGKLNPSRFDMEISINRKISITKSTQLSYLEQHFQPPVPGLWMDLQESSPGAPLETYEIFSALTSCHEVTQKILEKNEIRIGKDRITSKSDVLKTVESGKKFYVVTYGWSATDFIKIGFKSNEASVLSKKKYMNDEIQRLKDIILKKVNSGSYNGNYEIFFELREFISEVELSRALESAKLRALEE